MKKFVTMLVLSVLAASCVNKQKDYKNMFTPYSVSGLERVVIYDHCEKCLHGVYLPDHGKRVCTFCNSEKLVSK